MVQTDKMRYNRHECKVVHLEEKMSLPEHKVGGTLAYQQFI